MSTLILPRTSNTKLLNHQSATTTSTYIWAKINRNKISRCLIKFFKHHLHFKVLVVELVSFSDRASRLASYSIVSVNLTEMYTLYSVDDIKINRLEMTYLEVQLLVHNDLIEGTCVLIVRQQEMMRTVHVVKRLRRRISENRCLLMQYTCVGVARHDRSPRRRDRLHLAR